MTIRDLFTARVLAAAALGGAVAPAGCSRPGPESAAETPVVALAPHDAGGAANPRPDAARPEPPAPPPEFAFPSDRTGKALARVVVPEAAAAPADDGTGAAPKPRAVPGRVLDPEAIARASYVPPTVLVARPGAARPTDPTERLPLDMGVGVRPVRLKLPVAPVVTARAPDVNVPPPLPPLGRQAGDRASLEDPTSELGNAAVVAGAAKTPLEPSGFLKVTIPDPFELAEQVRPKVPPTAEPSADPVPVNPPRAR
jgi:hypothetical protein